MGDACEINTATNGGYRQYLDMPFYSESETEERIRNLSRHKSGKCVNLDQFVSEMGRNTNGRTGNELPCEFCLLEALTKSFILGEPCSWCDTGKDPEFQDGLSRRKSPANSEQVRRPSWKESDMKPKNSRPLTRSYKFTKKELDSFLPRKSFFNCHDKALKDAGYNPDQQAKKREDMRQTIRVQNVDQIVDCEVKETCNPEDVLPSIMVSISDDKHTQSNEDLTHNSTDEGHALQGKRHHWPSKSKLLDRKKMEEDLSKNEYRVLTEYFRYVKEHQSEYVDHVKRHERDSAVEKPVETLIKTAMAYQRGHHGRPRDSPVVRASHDLKPRYTDPGQWTQVNKEKNHPVFSLKKKESIVPKSGPEGDNDRQAQDEGKTELDRHRYRAEKWLKTVPANQQMRARLMALEEVGEEDLEVTQWWTSLQTCHYIRRQGGGEEDS